MDLSFKSPIKHTYWILPLLMNVEVAIFPVLVLFFNNADEVSFSETTSALLFECVLAVICFFANLIVFRSPFRAGFCSALLVLLTSNFYYFYLFSTELSTWVRYWHVLPIALVLVIMFGLVLTEIHEDLLKYITNSVILVFFVLIVFNGLLKIPTIIQRNSNVSKLANESSPGYSQIENMENTSNVYIMIFDEYAGFKQIKDAYDYDNTELKEFLGCYGFTISEGSHNESIMTTTVVTNMMNYDYVVDNYTSSSEKELLRKNGMLFKTFSDNNYKIQIIECSNFIGENSGDRRGEPSAGKTIDNLNFFQVILNRSFLFPFVKEDGNSVIKDILNTADYVMKMNKPDTNTLTVVYLTFPHQPFYVNDKGEFNITSDYNDWKNKELYLGQFKYSTKLMMKMVKAVIEKDRESVVMICSDHGARASTDPDLFLKDNYSYEYASNQFLAVYYKGQEYNKIVAQSNVNVIRLIMDDVLGTHNGVIQTPEDTYNYLEGK